MYVKHFFQLNRHTIDMLQDMEPNFGYDGFGEFIFYRTYSRVNKEGKQENWADVVQRVIEGTFSIRKNHYLNNMIPWDELYWQGLAKRMAISMFKMEWLPPGRGLWAMGTDFIYQRGGMALYNCSATYINFETLDKDLAWFMDSLMLGVGVGFSPLREDYYHFKNPKGVFKYIIPDSREGWVEGYAHLIRAYMYGASKPIFDFSEIRPKGLPIKGFGGISSGPDPLKYLYEWTEQAIDRYMTDIYYDSVILKTDLANQIGCCVVAGNVRRSAELACLSIKDTTFKNLKDYKKYPEREAHGWMSNNSVILEDTSDFDELPNIAKSIIKNGEPGFLNLINFPKGRLGKKDNLREDKGNLVNPCFSPSLSKVLTKYGIRTIGEINIGDEIWSDYHWTKIVNKWSTGINDVYRYTTTSGVFYGTKNHRIIEEGSKIEVQYAEAIDRCIGPATIVNIEQLPKQTIIDGIVIGDGENKEGTILLNIGINDQDYFEEFPLHIGIEYNKEYQNKVLTYIKPEELPNTYNRRVPERYLKANDITKCAFLRGLYSANGSICGNRITLKASSKQIIEDVQLMLSSLGIPSYYTTNKTKDIKFTNGIYKCKESYDLNINWGRKLFAKCIGFVQKYKQENLKKLLEIKEVIPKKTFDIISVELLHQEETFEITVDNPTHTLWCGGLNVSNCSEIILENKEVCNISETLPTMCDSTEKWYEACKYASIYSSSVSLLPTHQPETNKVIARNRRIGISIIDFSGWVSDLGVSRVIKNLRKGYKIVRETNRQVNSEAGIPEAIRVTTIKPGGTVPKLAGKTSGIMHPNFHYMIRRVRVARNHPVHQLLVEANFPYENDWFSHNTDVFEFPVKTNTDVPEAGDVSIWQQAMNLILLQREWADNSVSNTLNFRPKWILIKNIEEGNIEEKLRNELDNLGYNQLYSKIELTLHQKDSYEDPRHKITIKWNDDFNHMTEAKIYQFDPRHEENSIEAVLASIAPLTKSVSMLPHTTKGVYRQMPEEGITKEEYYQRLKTIKKIDWSKLSGSDGEDNRYCEGPACELSKGI